MAADPPIPVSMDEAFDVMRSWGYEDGIAPGTIDQFRGLFTAWHLAGDAVLLFSNRDLGSLTSRPLGIAMPWDVPNDLINGWPPHSPDLPDQLGWRYLPTHYVLPPGA